MARPRPKHHPVGSTGDHRGRPQGVVDPSAARDRVHARLATHHTQDVGQPCCGPAFDAVPALTILRSMQASGRGGGLGGATTGRRRSEATPRAASRDPCPPLFRASISDAHATIAKETGTSCGRTQASAPTPGRPPMPARPRNSADCRGHVGDGRTDAWPRRGRWVRLPAPDQHGAEDSGVAAPSRWLGTLESPADCAGGAV